MQKAAKRYIVNEKGHKTGVLLTLKEYKALLEDLQDLAIIAERKGESSQPFEVVKKKLESKWRNTSLK